MQIHDPSRAERKLAQLGYYRLSGYWYPAREFKMNGLRQDVCPVTGKPLRLDTFQAATTAEGHCCPAWVWAPLTEYLSSSP